MTEHRLIISIRPSEDGEGLDVDAWCDEIRADGSQALPGWVWSGWAESGTRAAAYASAEWEAHCTKAL